MQQKLLFHVVEVMISLSNLFKQRYVINLENEKVIINSDDRFFSNGQMQNIAFPTVDVVPNTEEVLDEFIAGLNAEEVFIEPQPTPEDLLLEAQVEADRIIAAASAEAARIENEASHHAAMLYEQKRQEGYNTGAAQSRSEIDAEKRRLQAEYDAMAQSIASDFESKFDTMEQDIVDVMIRVFNKVFHIQFDNKKQILLHLIKDTLLGIDAGKAFAIRVSEANFKFVESHVADIKEKIGNDVNIDVINDLTLEDEACIIETENGVYNCGIEMVLNNLEKDIRSLCCMGSLK